MHDVYITLLGGGGAHAKKTSLTRAWFNHDNQIRTRIDLFYNINLLSDYLQCFFLNTVRLNFAIPSATISLRPAILRIVDSLLPLFN